MSERFPGVLAPVDDRFPRTIAYLARDRMMPPGSEEQPYAGQGRPNQCLSVSQCRLSPQFPPLISLVKWRYTGSRIVSLYTGIPTASGPIMPAPQEEAQIF